MRKAMFITRLSVYKHDHRHWELRDPLMVEFDPGLPARGGSTLPDLVVPTGFITDFSSAPRTPLAWWIGGGIGDMSAVVHDYLCTEPYLVTSSVAADAFDACLRVEIGVPTWRRIAMVKAVRLFGPRF